MLFQKTPIAGVYVLEMEKKSDDRGFFGRTHCERDFSEEGLSGRFYQSSVSYNLRRGTVRGMHLQLPPHEEIKLVRCTQGAIFDVALDLRPDSSSFSQWFGIELTPDNHRSLYIPEGCAHGFQTLEDDTEVYYQITPEYSPEHSSGVRWNDPRFSIRFPIPISVIADRDLNFSDFKDPPRK